MSDAIRNYSVGSGFDRKLASHQRGGGLPLATFATVGLLLLGAWAYWVSRDTYPIESFIPEAHIAYLQTHDIVDRRPKLAASSLWKTVPPDSPLVGVSEALEQDLPVPEWLARHLFPATCHIVLGSAEDSKFPLLLASRMTRLGTVLTRFVGWVPGTKDDDAGGLRLTRIGDSDLFLAIRGRVILLSPSRRTLIHALTLANDEQASFGDLPRLDEELDLVGRVRLEQSSLGGTAFREVTFSLALTESKLEIHADADLLVKTAELFHKTFPDATAGSLAQPLPGTAALSFNFGQPIRETTIGLSRVLDLDLFNEQQWNAWERAGDESAAPLVSTLLGQAGPAVALTWQGVDVHEVLPAPELVLLAANSRARVTKIATALPGPREGPALHPLMPYYESASERVIVPMLGGASIEPTMGFIGDQWTASTSLRVYERLSEQRLHPLPVDHGLVYFEATPDLVIDQLGLLGDLLAENQLLRDHTQESFARSVVRWRRQFEPVDRVRVFASVKEGTLRATLQIEIR